MKFESIEGLDLKSQRDLDRGTPMTQILHDANLDDKLISMLLRNLQPSVLPSVQRKYEGSGYVPIGVLDSGHTAVVYTDGLETVPGVLDNKAISYKVPLAYYLVVYHNLYGAHPVELRESGRAILDNIVAEALSQKAAEITLSQEGNLMTVHYTIAKQQVPSLIRQDQRAYSEIISILTSHSNKTARIGDEEPANSGVDLSEDYRGRVSITSTYKGSLCTIRLLPNTFFTQGLEDWNLHPEVIKFIREKMMSSKPGLRLLVGPTFSGKNTTILATLNETLRNKNAKVMSIESPVEQRLNGVYQVEVADRDKMAAVVESSVRHNPDVLYMTELNSQCADKMMPLLNTGKVVYSTLHANGCAEAFARMQDISGYTIDKLLLMVPYVIHQELLRDENTGKLYPVNTVLDTTSADVLGKPFSEVYKGLKAKEVRYEGSR